MAVTSALLEAFGPNLGIGYDIGCKFKTTIMKSPLGTLAQDLNHTSLIGSFHGHAHNRLCQLSSLTTYVKGVGLEDLEGCERFFSKSNALAKSIRFASSFHRQQSIVDFLKHMDDSETYQNLSKSVCYPYLTSLTDTGKFLVSNYCQALKILRGEGTLRLAMDANGIGDPSIFTTWLQEEKKYLEDLKHEPPQETLEMEYYKKLINFYEFEYVNVDLFLFDFLRS